MTADVWTTDLMFRWWLVGLVDGEGHFGVARTQHGGRPRPHYRCVFRVSMTAAERPMLQEAQRRTGWGRIYEYAGSEERHGAAIWTTDAKMIGQVADFFEEYPLRSRKAEDFALWAPAARAQSSRRRAGRGNVDEEAFAVMADAYERLRTLRASRRVREDVGA